MPAPRMIARHALGVLTALLVVLVSVPALAHTLTVGSFNVESGGADIDTVASRIALQTDVDLWGLSEVQNASAAEVLRTAMENATGATVRAVVGTTGGADRLVVLLNESRLTFVKHFELNGTIIQACGSKNSRAPLVVEFKVKGLERRMWFMVNHFQRVTRTTATARPGRSMSGGRRTRFEWSPLGTTTSIGISPATAPSTIAGWTYSSQMIGSVGFGQSRRWYERSVLTTAFSTSC
jgi:hypothetical protein